MKQGFKFLLLASLLWSALGAQSVKVEKEIKKLESRGIPYFYNQEIEQTTKDWLLNENGGTSIVLGRYKYYSKHIDAVRRKYDLPWFVAMIPAGNTGFETRYKDEAGFSGMWPLSYLIAKKYGLVQMALYDERRDPNAADVAACRYLKDLYIIYGDWLKVITAFKIGPARLNQVIHTAGTLDFNRIYTLLEPQERIPVIQFYSAMVALNYCIEEGEIRETEFKQIESDTVSSVTQILPFTVIQEHFDVSVNDLRNLNPSLKTDFVPYMGKAFVFRMPKKMVSKFRAKIDSIDYWLMAKPLKPIQYDTMLEVLENNDTVTILKTSEEPHDVESTVIPKPLADRKIWVYYTVKKGDGLFTLTDIFDCTPTQMRSWNRIRGNELALGRSLKFYVYASKKAFYTNLNNLTILEKRNIAEQD